MARNSGIIGEGYLHAARYLQKLKPDLLMGGHSWVMPKPANLIDRYWVSAYPYRVDLSQEREATIEVTVRNFGSRPQKHHIELKLPPGITASPAILTGTIPDKSRKTVTAKLTFDRFSDPQHLQIATFDITLGDQKYGELFDFLIKTKGASNKKRERD